MLTLPEQALERSRVDLVGLIRDGVPQPACVPGGDPWLLVGKRYLIPAPAGTGKSLAALAIAVAVVEHGGHAIILDVENGSHEYARRLEDVLRARDPDGTLAQGCQERLRYHAYPDLDLRWTPDAWVAAVAGADLIIFDSSRFMLSKVGLAEDRADDYSEFISKLILPLTTAGTCTMVLDNTGLVDRDRARGTSSKADLNEVVYALKVGAPFDRERAGHLRLVQTRSRFAGLPRELHLHLGGDTYTAPVAVAEEDRTHERPFRPTALMERASTAIEAEPGLSKRSIRTVVGGKSDYVDLALNILVGEGYVEVRRAGQATQHHPIRPYREADEQTDRDPVPQPCPNRAPVTAVRDRDPVPPSLKGTGTGHGHGSHQTADRDPDAELAHLNAKFGSDALEAA